MKYIQFARMPVKGRIKWVQDKLISLGFLNEDDCTPYVRDKKFIKSLKAFQEHHGMTPNADIKEELFDKLNYN